MMSDFDSDDCTQRHPEERASFVSRITFFWLIDLFKFGHKHQITANDIFGVRCDDSSAKLFASFAALWKNELRNGGGNLWRVIAKFYGIKVALCGLMFSIVDTILRLLQPQFLGAFLNFFAPNQTGMSTSQAIYFAAGTILCSLVPVLAFHPFFLYLLNIGQRIRIACCSLLYKKVLKLPKASTQLHADVTSLMSRDTNKLDYAFATFHEIYRAPLEAFFIALCVHKEVGVAGLFGIVLMLAFVPLLFYIVKKSANYRSQAVHQTEKRVHLMGEIIEHIATIKTFCMEQIYAKMIKERRKRELKMMRGVLYLRATSMSLSFAFKLSIFVCIATSLSSRSHFDASSVYVVISYYSMLFTSMLQFWPVLTTYARDAYRTVDKIQELLLTVDASEGKNADAKTITCGALKRDGEEICRDVNLTEHLLSKSGHKCLRRINEESDVKGISIRNVLTLSGVKCDCLEMLESKSYAITEAASSMLFSILLGEIDLESGEIDINGSISYASKNPWIFAGSIRENITFTEQFNAERYSKVLRVLSIENEIEALPNGSDTLIDEFSMGEGFKRRIHLARCLYREADIYLIDDCFSKMMKSNEVSEVIQTILKDKIVIISTSHTVAQSNCIISVRESSIEMNEASKDFNNSVHKPEETHEDELESKFGKITEEENLRQLQFAPESLENQISENIEWSSYQKYFKFISSSKCGILWLTILFVFAQLNTSGLELFIAKWLNHEETHRHAPSVNITEKISSRNNNSFRENEAFASNYDNWVNFVYFYAAFLCTLLYFTVHRSFLFFKLCLRAGAQIHDKLFCGITRATLRFFERNSFRQILSHFTGDIEKLDNQVATTLYDSIIFLFETIGIFILITLVNYWLLLPTLALVLAVFALRSCYIDTARSLRRVESLTHNSIHSRIISTFHGLSTIHSTHSERVLMDEFLHNMDENTSAMYLNLAATRAFALWLDIMCSIYICVVILSFLLLKSEDAGSSFVGMAITQALHLPFFLQWGIRQTVEVGNQMTSVERIFHYRYITTEAPLRTPNKHRPSKEWPQSAKIIFTNFHLRYSSDGCDVLKDLNFRINPGEKIGIVGGRRAGKSSIVQALLRFRSSEGSIEIDDINIDTLGLHDIRRCFGIIPANPILFNGSIRCNLDPLEQSTDEKIWEALERVGLKERVSSVPGALSAAAHGQHAFSIKEMQLLYAARVLLAKSKILILDETTDELRDEDDNEVQEVLRRNFANCTVLVASKRLSNIMDCDNIIVLDDGRVVEFGHPYELIQSARGHFRSLIDKTGYESVVNLIKIAEKCYFTKKM